MVVLLVWAAQAQSVTEYHSEFVIDAKSFDRALYLPPPSFVETEQSLYIVEKNKRVLVDAKTEHGERTIYFNVNSYMYEYNRKVLVYHELGHYYLNRRHTDRNSIMNVNIWGWNGWTWDDMSRSHQKVYLQELFKYK